MAARKPCRRGLLFAACAGLTGPVLADPVPVAPSGVPPQIIPAVPEVGVTIMQMPGSGNQPGTGSGSVGDPTGGGSSPGDGAAYDTMMQQSYGQAAVADAHQAGINVNALADIGQAESGFRNVLTANGSSSATGPWQITTGTFTAINQQYNLGYSPSDTNDPAAQAQVASYIIQDYANAVTQATGQPATVVQTYGAYVFGPTAGAQMAMADPTTPLCSFVSARTLANNNMQGWTVGQFQQGMAGRLGSTSGQTVQVSA